MLLLQSKFLKVVVVGDPKALLDLAEKTRVKVLLSESLLFDGRFFQ